MVRKKAEEKKSRETLEKEMDFLGGAKCKYCENLIIRNNKFFCQNEGKEVKEDDTCSFWEERKENKLRELYRNIIDILKYYVEMREENYKLVALWILCTYIYDFFPTFPYLFFNAMRGSAKTRMLKLIKAMAKDGDMLTSLSEAVLFRTTGTLCIDEFEGISGKDKNNLRELLNTAYKKGGKVKRMKKVKRRGIDGNFEEVQVVEEFNTFRPIAMANIWGLEEVLEDRCITLILEKSNNPMVTMLIENFEIDPKIKQILENVSFWCCLCCVVTSQNIYTEWNNYVKDINNTNNTNNITTLTTPNNTKRHFFQRIYESKIEGRNLELFLPLFLIARDIGEEEFEEILEISKLIIGERKQEEISESKDVLLYKFVSEKCDTEPIKIKDLTNQFRNFLGEEIAEDLWLNPKWIGRALKRLNLLKSKRRIGEGREVTLNVEKAKEKYKIFI